VLYGVCVDEDFVDETEVVANCDGGEKKSGCARDAL
jgi:hypothetical protein